jgi:hypothetical protein
VPEAVRMILRMIGSEPEQNPDRIHGRIHPTGAAHRAPVPIETGAH